MNPIINDVFNFPIFADHTCWVKYKSDNSESCGMAKLRHLWAISVLFFKQNGGRLGQIHGTHLFHFDKGMCKGKLQIVDYTRPKSR